MAFMGLFVIGVILAIFCVIVGLGLLFTVIGFILRHRKKRKASRIFFVLGAVNLTVALLFVVFVMIPKPKTIETGTGTVRIAPQWSKQYDKYLKNHDMENLRKLVQKHPELIWLYDANRVMLLDYGLYNCNLEIMQIALENGARFDEPLRYDHMSFYSSLDSFFSELDYPYWEKEESERRTTGETTQEIIDTVDFAIANGAALRWEVWHDFQTDNFYEIALEWVNADGVVSDMDRKLLNLIEERMKTVSGEWPKNETDSLKAGINNK